MEYVWIALAGLLVGAVAKFIMPGKDPGGIWVTMLIGIIGTYIGYFIRGLLNPNADSSFNLFSPLDWFYSIAGALILLFVWKKFLAPMFDKK